MDLTIFCRFYFWLLNTLGSTAFAWLCGLFISLVLGHFITKIFLERVRKKYSIEKPFSIKRDEKEKKAIPAVLVGPLERLFFTFLVVYALSGTPIAMIGWITVKMYQKWGRRNENKNYAFSRLLGGLISMLFALWGGLLIRYLDP